MLSNTNFEGKGKAFLAFMISNTSFDGQGNVFLALSAFRDQL